MLNAIIRFALQQRLVVLAVALCLMGVGVWQINRLPIDVFPDLNRPRVVVLAEAHGMAPEEVEAQITIPIERALNGATGVQAVRSSSADGIAVVYAEFDWGTDIYTDRQIVNERLQLVTSELRDLNVTPQLAPVASLMGQIMIIGMYPRDKLPPRKTKPPAKSKQPPAAPTTPMELRTLADWVVRPRLMAIPGVAQVFAMGGERKQFQVLINPRALLDYGVSLHEVREALEAENRNSTGGYLVEQGPGELLVRAIGRIKSVDDLEELAVKHRDGRSVLLRHVAKIVEGPQVKRGDSSAFQRKKKRRDEEQKPDKFDGGPAVVLTVTKQPGADTRQVSDAIAAALKGMGSALPADIEVVPELYQQRSFIDRAIYNVVEALGIGSVLVVIILFLFLFNFRTTFITLTAIPTSIVITALVFAGFGLSINTMTLGGLAVAIGELVDDAIVDVENIYRRLRENGRLEPAQRRHPLLIVYQASSEIRNSIVFGTFIVVLVFLPLFAIPGMAGRLFVPLGVSYIVSLSASLLVSLTLTPVLSYWLLGGRAQSGDNSHHEDSFLLRRLKTLAAPVIRFALEIPLLVLGVAAVAVAIAAVGLWGLQRKFLPEFNEGAVQVNVALPPGVSLKTTNHTARAVERQLRNIPDVDTLVRRSGRAELDEHAVGVNVTEIIVSLDPDSPRGREEILDDIRDAIAAEHIPGVMTSVEQPIAHLISHMLSGVQAQVAIKLYGDDLGMLLATGRRMRAAIDNADGQGVPGVVDPFLEQLVDVRQLRIEVDRRELARHGLRPGDINEFVETALGGRVISQVLLNQRTFDLLLRLDQPYREDLRNVRRLSIDLPGEGKGKIPLERVAKVHVGYGPYAINHERTKRRIVLQCNVSGRGVVDVVEDIRTRLEPIIADLPSEGYFVEYGGQFQEYQTASRTIAVLLVVALAGMFLVLFALFRSANLAMQVMVALPMAFIGAVAALYLTRQNLTIAAMVGFVSLCGIAARNGILLINHYLHLVQHEGETWTPHLLIRAGQERLAPVLMTALTSGIGLVPLALAAGQPGKEILYPVATVIIGGLISSTLLEFLVRPALFWQFGLPAGKRVVERGEQEDVWSTTDDKTRQPIHEIMA